jgi:hypothetical protein
MRDTAIFLTFWGVATLLWVLSATVWKVATLKKLPPGTTAWFWLRAFGIPESDRNRGRLLNFIAIVGITILTGGVVAMLLFLRR